MHAAPYKVLSSEIPLSIYTFHFKREFISTGGGKYSRQVELDHQI